MIRGLMKPRYDKGGSRALKKMECVLIWREQDEEGTEKCADRENEHEKSGTDLNGCVGGNCTNLETRGTDECETGKYGAFKGRGKKIVSSYRMGTWRCCSCWEMVWRYEDVVDEQVQGTVAVKGRCRRPKWVQSEDLNYSNGWRVTKCNRDVEMRQRQQRIQVVGMRHQRQQ